MKPTNIDNLHIELIIDLNGDILKVSSGQFIKNQFAIGDSIYTICPFLLGTIEGLPLREPYLVEGMFINANDREYGIDLDLFKATDNVTVLINDRTNVYNFVNHLNQQRNDLFFLKRELAQKNKELHRLRKAADIANEQKSRFLAMMSHEVRNPLNVILGYTELISKEEISLKVKDYLKNLAISGRNLKVIVDDILDLSRVEAGKLQLANDPMNLHHIIDQIENNYKTSHKDTDVVLVFEADKTIPNSIFGDDVRLIQIITNLINNSIKFTPRGKVHTKAKLLSTDNDKAKISFSVKDTGRGMTAEQAERVFEEYQQNTLDDNRVKKGAGLGLSIVKRLVDEMNGRISVDSYVDVGTTITIDIPFEICKGSENKDIQDEATSSKSIEGKKILVADDNFLNLTIVSHILVKEKTDFKMVKDGVEALEALQNDTYDIVLLDINMPNLSGEELIMRRNEVHTTNPNTPFVAMTGNSTKEDVIVYKRLGFIDVIPKPYSTEQFTEIVKKHL